MSAASVRLAALSKRFGDATAVDELSMDVAPGEFMVLVGPSGAGKSTVLRLIAGLEEPTSGTIELDGQDIHNVPARERNIAMIFQDYALYPHMTCFQNIAYGLKVRRVPAAQARERVLATARRLGVEDLLDRRPATLSGGQRQRIAMGRAIVRDPAVFLMDEPLSNLDARLRVHMRAELRALQQRLGVTTLFVTHDQVEAMTMGDRVAVMHAGRLRQIGSPRALYNAPASIFVAGFIGTPAMNFLVGEVSDGSIRIGGRSLPLSCAEQIGEHDAVIVGFRPEDVLIGNGGARGDLDGRVRAAELLGHETILHVEIPAMAPALPELAEINQTPDTNRREPSALIVARAPAATTIRAGERLAISIQRARLFDAETHAAIAPIQFA